MKFAIATAAVFLLLGTTSSALAQENKGQDKGQGHEQASKPAQQQSKPAQQQHAQQAPQQRPAPQQHAQQQTKPAQQQHAQQTQQARPAQQHTQQAVRSQAQPSNNARQGNGGQTQSRAAQSNQGGGNRPGYTHGQISDVHYRASFGSGHNFHVNRGDYNHRRFNYGGYSFGFVDPWPVAWGYSDDVYVQYVDGGYYMYDAFHPGLRISINIF